MAKGVARQALLVDDMQRVTMNGPMRLGAPFSMTMRCASKKFDVDGYRYSPDRSTSDTPVFVRDRAN